MVSLLAASTYLFRDNPFYVEVLGAMTSTIEAMFPVPQFMKIHTNKHTYGCAIALILNWIAGSAFKLRFYIVSESPT